MEKKKIDTQKLINHLNQKWGQVKCPLCNHGQWNISDTVYELREYNDGNMVIGNVPIVPVVPVTCMNCGNTVLVNALLSGAVAQPKKDDEKEKEGGDE